jgi:hypothetical protein
MVSQHPRKRSPRKRPGGVGYVERLVSTHNKKHPEFLKRLSRVGLNRMEDGTRGTFSFRKDISNVRMSRVQHGNG